MDDKERDHRADIVDDYLESEGIARMAWPAYSPDLNPIEILWNDLGRAVSSRFSPPATLIEVETALQEEWRLLSSAVVDYLMASMVTSYLFVYQKQPQTHGVRQEENASYTTVPGTRAVCEISTAATV
ncbi:hypothetical protein X975_18946, partial [Stegodyphus mimosarum]